MNIELRHLRAVVAVAEYRHFSEAARSLHMSQPNLSRLIRDIEAKLQTKLFDRHTRGVSLTPFGREFIRHASSVLDLHTSGMSNLQNLVGIERGHVTVATLPSITTSLLALAIRKFRVEHPAIEISIRDDIAARITEFVREARADFGIGHATDNMNDLEARPLLSDDLMLVCHAGHRLGSRTECEWRELADERIIAFSAGSSVRPLMEQAFAANGMTLQPAIETIHLSSAEGLALQGLGVAILPSSRTQTISEPELSVVAIRKPKMTRDLVLIQRRGRSLSPAAQVLRDMLAEMSAEGVNMNLAGMHRRP